MSTYKPYEDKVNTKDPIVKMRPPKFGDDLCLKHFGISSMKGMGVTASGKNVLIDSDGAAILISPITLVGQRPCRTSDAYALAALGIDKTIQSVGYVSGGGKVLISDGCDAITNRPCRMLG